MVSRSSYNDLDFTNISGVLLSSSYEYPGRYSRWTVGFIDPPLIITGRGLNFSIEPLNERGVVISKIIWKQLQTQDYNIKFDYCNITHAISGAIIPKFQYFSEEERSKQASLFTLIRVLKSIFASADAGQLGFYGSFGYDLAFQFESINLRKVRDDDQRDLILYFPDEVLVVDNQRNDAYKLRYDFISNDSDSLLSTVGIDRRDTISKYRPSDSSSIFNDREYPAGGYADNVVRASQEFKVGNLFEVVLSQSFRRKMLKPPSQIFKRLSKIIYCVYTFI